MITLQPLRFPRPTPIPIWTDDYADLPERIRRAGRLDTEEIWLPHSGDSWPAFCGRHGTYEFEFDWRELTERDHAVKQRQSERRAADARQQQERWEAARREREQVKQTKADREWEEITTAKAYWSRRRPSYATESYRNVSIDATGRIDGVELQGGQSYWLPRSIAQALRAYARAHGLTTVT